MDNANSDGALNNYKIAKLQSVMQSFEEGIIPKENVFLINKLYFILSNDASLKAHVSFEYRAVKHIVATRETADDVLELLHKCSAFKQPNLSQGMDSQ